MHPTFSTHCHLPWQLEGVIWIGGGPELLLGAFALQALGLGVFVLQTLALYVLVLFALAVQALAVDVFVCKLCLYPGNKEFGCAPR